MDSVKNQKVPMFEKPSASCRMPSRRRGDESTLLGLATIKNYDDYTFTIASMWPFMRSPLARDRHIKEAPVHLEWRSVSTTSGRSEFKRDPEQDWKLTLRMGHHPGSSAHRAETLIRMKDWGELSTRMVAAAFGIT